MCGFRQSKDENDTLTTVIDMVFAKTSIPQDQEAVHHVHLPAVKEESVTETLGPENAEVDPEVLPTTDITDAS